MARETSFLAGHPFGVPSRLPPGLPACGARLWSGADSLRRLGPGPLLPSFGGPASPWAAAVFSTFPRSGHHSWVPGRAGKSSASFFGAPPSLNDLTSKAMTLMVSPSFWSRPLTATKGSMRIVVRSRL